MDYNTFLIIIAGIMFVIFLIIFSSLTKISAERYLMSKTHIFENKGEK